MEDAQRPFSTIQTNSGTVDVLISTPRHPSSLSYFLPNQSRISRNLNLFVFRPLNNHRNSIRNSKKIFIHQSEHKHGHTRSETNADFGFSRDSASRRLPVLKIRTQLSGCLSEELYLKKKKIEERTLKWLAVKTGACDRSISICKRATFVFFRSLVSP